MLSYLSIITHNIVLSVCVVGVFEAARAVALLEVVYAASLVFINSVTQYIQIFSF